MSVGSIVEKVFTKHIDVVTLGSRKRILSKLGRSEGGGSSDTREPSKFTDPAQALLDKEQAQETLSILTAKIKKRRSVGRTDSILGKVATESNLRMQHQFRPEEQARREQITILKGEKAKFLQSKEGLILQANALISGGNTPGLRRLNDGITFPKGFFDDKTLTRENLRERVKALGARITGGQNAFELPDRFKNI